MRHNLQSFQIFVPAQAQDTRDIIQRWEAKNNTLITDKKHKSPVLKTLVRACGLNTNLSVPRLRSLLICLKNKPLPVCPKQVDLMLISRGESVTGPGRRSTQQRKLLLLELIDPNLKTQMGTNIIETGDFQWGDHLVEDLNEAVTKNLTKWVPLLSEPPFLYDSTTTYLWERRRQAGLTWVESSQGHAFVKEVYKCYASVFSTVTKDCARSAFTSALELFFVKKRQKEEGDLNHVLQTSLRHLCSPCMCTADNVVDTFSFITRNLYQAVFNFFTSKVRKVSVVKMPKRVKDREDDAKTYYICGCVLRTLMTQAKHKPKHQSKELLSSLEALTVKPNIAAKLGLPTRHVTIKNRGGLLFASKQYYELMNKIEMRFYSTITMRKNLALAQPDVIQNIKNELLLDAKLYAEFESMIPTGADVLWEMLVDRISNLHGTELASQLMEELAALKRKSQSTKNRVKPQKRTLSAKYESLRAARKQKKLERVSIVLIVCVCGAQ